MQREIDYTDWRPSMNTQEQPGDALETSATEVHDGGIGIKDASEPIVEALNSGEPVKPEDLKAIRQEIFELEGALQNLKDELDTLPSG
jgi:hypothetical protein